MWSILGRSARGPPSPPGRTSHRVPSIFRDSFERHQHTPEVAHAFAKFSRQCKHYFCNPLQESGFTTYSLEYFE